MVLSWNQYLICIDHFLYISKKVDDGWTLVGENGAKRLPENCYLYKTSFIRVQVSSLQQTESMLQLEEGLEQDDVPTNSTELRPIPEETLVWEYHIIFSQSYGVPVLYFNIRNTAGKLLTLGDVWNLLKVPAEILAEKWSFVTQNQHPILCRPFFHLHPCKSFNLFEISRGSHVNPFVTWLSSIADIVHLNMSLEYGQSRFTCFELTEDESKFNT